MGDGLVQTSNASVLRLAPFSGFPNPAPPMSKEILDETSGSLTQAAKEARGLAIDAVHACSSGHLGLPLGCAEIGAVLFGETMRYNPSTPGWLNRDRFILSAGHGSMFLYSWLHLSGYDLSLQAVKDFRKLHSVTPGHPEYQETPGVEATTGPLGQGVGNAVGYALSGKRAAARFNTPEHTLFDHHVIALAGDGCMQEGVARESIAFAGHCGLDNLILIYDSNDVTLDAMAEVTQSEDAESYFAAVGWDAVTVDGHDITAVGQALQSAKENDNGNNSEDSHRKRHPGGGRNCRWSWRGRSQVCGSSPPRSRFACGDLSRVRGDKEVLRRPKSRNAE